MTERSISEQLRFDRDRYTQPGYAWYELLTEAADHIDALAARLAEAEADLRIAFGWGDPFDMTPEDAAVWRRLQAKYAPDNASVEGEK